MTEQLYLLNLVCDIYKREYMYNTGGGGLESLIEPGLLLGCSSRASSSRAVCKEEVCDVKNNRRFGGKLFLHTTPQNRIYADRSCFVV